MKISKFFVNDNGLFRHQRTSVLITSRSSVIQTFGRILNFIYARIWHHLHTMDEIKQDSFFCIVCEHPEFYKIKNYLYFEFVIFSNNVNKFVRNIARWISHLYHRYYIGISDNINCRICSKKRTSNDSTKSF